jgi:hypothetical protein
VSAEASPFELPVPLGAAEDGARFYVAPFMDGHVVLDCGSVILRSDAAALDVRAGPPSGIDVGPTPDGPWEPLEAVQMREARQDGSLDAALEAISSGRARVMRYDAARGVLTTEGVG